MPVTVCVRKRSHVSAWKSFATWKSHSRDTRGPRSAVFVCDLEQGGTYLCISEIHERPKSFVLGRKHVEKLSPLAVPSPPASVSGLPLLASSVLGSFLWPQVAHCSISTIMRASFALTAMSWSSLHVCSGLLASCDVTRSGVLSGRSPPGGAFPHWLLGAQAQLHCIPLK